MKIEVYTDKAGELRWRALAENNKVIAEGGEGYKNRDDLYDTLDLLFKHQRQHLVIRDFGDG